ncbi:MAG: SufE family protein [Parachlamydia sp.]|nr:SufE family protein [Parachlamydia sp.]
MYPTCLEKQNQVRQLFAACRTEEDKYQKIIELGHQLTPLDAAYKVPENIVKGCQSIVYLRSSLENDKVQFEVESEALISAGLAAILIKVYSGETPEAILKCLPAYLEDLGISASLTPSRANGLYSIHLRMKQDALKWLINGQKA